MKKKPYMFLTLEGYTFQPDSITIEPDIENLQVIGVAFGISPKEAFQNLLKENKYLLNTTFNEIFCYQLADNYRGSKEYFYISGVRKNNEVYQSLIL